MKPSSYGQIPGQARATAKRLLLRVLGISGVANLLLLTVPIYMLQIYDRVLRNGSLETLLVLTILALPLLICYGLLHWQVRKGFSALGGALDEMFMPVVARAVVEGRSTELQDSLTRLRNVFTGGAPAGFLDLFWAPFFMIVLFLIHPLLGIVALVGGVILFGIAYRGDRKSRDVVEARRNAQDSFQSLRSATLKGHEAITGNNMGAQIASRLEHLRKPLTSVDVDSSVTRSGYLSAARAMRLVLQLALLGCGAVLAVAGDISAGVIVAGSIMMGRALAPVESSLSNIRSLSSARDAFDDLCLSAISVNADDSRVKDFGRSWKLDAEHVLLKLPGQDEFTLRNVNFSVRSGELLVVVGIIGSGKSTLLNVLTGRAFTAGRIRYYCDDIEVSAKPVIGYAPQTPQLFPGTVAENIGRFCAENPKDVEDAIRTAGVERIIASLSKGHETSIAQKGELSGGQAQAVNLARAFFGDPPILVIDEPTSNLDPITARAVLDAILHARQRGRIVIVSTHSNDIVEHANKALVMQVGGEARFYDSHEKLPHALTRSIGDRKAPLQLSRTVDLRKSAGTKR